LEKIRGKLESWIHLPESVAVQFNSFEHILNLPENEAIAEKIEVRYENSRI
jgi:hypothetical protein